MTEAAACQPITAAAYRRRLCATPFRRMFTLPSDRRRGPPDHPWIDHHPHGCDSPTVRVASLVHSESRAAAGLVQAARHP